jgi:small subunit ribosomal protein S9
MYYYATGKRKTAVARVRLIANGQGKIEINGMPGSEYLKGSTLLGTILEPLQIVSRDKDTDLVVRVLGGGPRGQAEAIRHGAARALCLMDQQFRKALKQRGFLTRDARMVERKKPGLKKARRAPQWAKR